MNKADAAALTLLMEILIGTKLEAFEAAKKLIVSKSSLAAPLLLEVVSRPRHRLSARMAATYALGFLACRAGTQQLARIAVDPHEPTALRGFAAEALGNIGDPRALGPLITILASEQPVSLKVWSIYAIGEIGGKKARVALHLFRDGRPRGRLLKGLNEALRRLDTRKER